MRYVWLALAIACHGPALPAVPSAGGPAWIELESEHFTVWTDAPESRGRKLIGEMEHFRQIVLGVGLASGNPEGKTFVIAMRDNEEVGEFIPEQFIAMAFGSGYLREPVILLPANYNDSERPVITHELTHAISFTIIHHQPHWFAEGLANFFATVRLDHNNAKGDFGTPLDHIVQRLKVHPPTPAARMFGCRNFDCMDDMFYATAWAMFTFLANDHSQQLLAFADRLDQLPDGADAQAWADVFPELTPSAMDSALRHWLAYGKHRVWRFDVKLQDWPVRTRKLADGDVYAARATLRHLRAPDKEPTELAAALAADPTNVLANMLAQNIRKTIPVDTARAVAAAHPDDWRSWFLVGQAADWHGEDGATARTKTCALMAARHIELPRPFCP